MSMPSSMADFVMIVSCKRPIDTRNLKFSSINARWPSFACCNMFPASSSLKRVLKSLAKLRFLGNSSGSSTIKTAENRPIKRETGSEQRRIAVVQAALILGSFVGETIG